MKLHAALAKALSQGGAACLFGVVGDANAYLVDAFIRQEGGRYIAAANENGAVLMAIGLMALVRRHRRSCVVS